MKNHPCTGDSAALLLSLVPASAKTIYPTRALSCVVYTDYTQIAEQCGMVGRFYPGRLFVRASRPSSYYYGPYN
jgi:hypothetical protein